MNRHRLVLVASVLALLTGCALLPAAPSTSAPQEPTATATPRPTVVVLPPDLVQTHQLELQPLPADAPAGLSRDEAVAIATDFLSALGGTDEIVWAEHGLGATELNARELEPVWIVVVKTDGKPRPGGPACDPDKSCTPVSIVREFAGAVIRDETREVVRAFSRGQVIEP
jgi:hypothetical protein